VLTKKKNFLFLILLSFLFPAQGQGEDFGMKALGWGMTLEDLNRVYQEKVNPGAALRADLSIYEIELQVSPNKTMKIPRGFLTVIQETTREAAPGAVGKPFGYLWEGKFFGRVVLFANLTGQSRTQVARDLKARYPEGRLFHKFSGGSMITDFELNADKMTIFTNERGVYFYEPDVLKRVIREEGRNIQDREYREGERLFQERGKSPI